MAGPVDVRGGGDGEVTLEGDSVAEAAAPGVLLALCGSFLLVGEGDLL